MRCSLALPIGLAVLLTSCSVAPTGVVARQNAGRSLLSADASANGRGGVMPAYYDAQLFTINAGHAPRQLFSDNEVADAAAAGEITLAPTDEVYRCSVIGPIK